MPAEFDYIRPDSLNAALDVLAEKGRSTQILAGGTDVVVDLRSGERTPDVLLDVSRLPELRVLELNGEELSVGAAVTLSEIENSELLAQHAPSLNKCAQTFASRQIRNVATIGGNVAHCSPCGDTLPPLVIHEADVELAGKGGLRRIPITSVASGPYACALPPGEVITRFILKPAQADFADFQKIGRRRALAIARLNLAAMVRRKENGKIDFIRVALGSCTPTPHRMTAVEAFLFDQRPTAERIWEAGRIMAETMIAITGRRHSTVYKEPAIQGLFMRLMAPLT
ncbi:MAG: FAD binding domain-containing protein [Desulfobacterales bacterium]